MHLEHLTKTQLVLLALLVSFVSSVVTGIVTVSLMSQTPPAVAQTVNRIIERTVEQVVPAAQTAAPIQPVKTVVVSEKEAAPQAIALAQKSMIRLIVADDPSQKVLARGLIIGNGTALTDSSALDLSLSYQAILPDGSVVPVNSVSFSTTSPFAMLALGVGSTTTLVSATIADAQKLQLGESIVRIGGLGNDTAGQGTLAELPDKNVPSALEADVSSATPGAILIDLSGAVVGMTTAQSLSLGSSFYSLIPPAR